MSQFVSEDFNKSSSGEVDAPWQVKLTRQKQSLEATAQQIIAPEIPIKNSGNAAPTENNESWPNVAEGQRIRVLKDRYSNESFAQKLQAGSSWKKTTVQQSTVTTHQYKNRLKFQKNLPVNSSKSESVASEIRQHVTDNQQTSAHALSYLEQHETAVEKHIILQPLCSVRDRETKKAKKQTQVRNFQPQDSHLCIIDGSQKDKWLQSELIKQPVSNKCPPSLEKDFPDLSSALKLLSKCMIRYEFEEPVADERENKHSRVKKQRKHQPRWNNPISVNIIDIIKESSGACNRIPYLNTQQIQVRNLEKKKLCGNILDSSNPIRKRGKHRETPPQKRLSKLKHIILSERCSKQKQREGMQMLQEKSQLSEKLNERPSINSVCEELTSLQITSNYINNNKKPTFSPDQLKEESATSSEEVVGVATEIIPSMTIGRVQENCITSSLHSRKFRDYCDNIRSLELDEAVTKLLRELYRFQDRHYKRDPIRAHAKRRFVLGIREVKKYLALKKLKAIVIAPDLEPVKSPGGLDETLVKIREEGRTQQIPVVFALGRRQLGFALIKKVPISIIGIINPEGAEDLYRDVLDQWRSAAVEYQEKVIELCSLTESKK